MCDNRLQALSQPARATVAVQTYYCVLLYWPSRCNVRPLQLSPEAFARRMSEELGLSPNFVQPIARSISRQLLDSDRVLSKWAERTVAPATENIRHIDIDVRFRSVMYRDRLQWDVNCLRNSPELFARCTVADLSLPQVLFSISAVSLSLHRRSLEICSPVFVVLQL